MICSPSIFYDPLCITDALEIDMMVPKQSKYIPTHALSLIFFWLCPVIMSVVTLRMFVYILDFNVCKKSHQLSYVQNARMPHRPSRSRKRPTAKFELSHMPLHIDRISIRRLPREKVTNRVRITMKYKRHFFKYIMRKFALAVVVDGITFVPMRRCTFILHW